MLNDNYINDETKTKMQDIAKNYLFFYTDILTFVILLRVKFFMITLLNYRVMHIC